MDTTPRTVTLRIKRVYLERILSGVKRVEYRDVKPFYDRLLGSRPVSALKLHYQTPRQVIVDVHHVERIPRPDHLGPGFGEYVYAIHLGTAREIVAG